MNKIYELFKLAESIAKSTYDKVLCDHGHLKKIKDDRRRDIKVEGDFQIDRYIINELKKTDITILTEESGCIEQKNNKYTWIVDPLDGSVNFHRGLPLCCISIGLWSYEKPIFGVIYDFTHNEIFKGIIGYGAWLNDAEIKVSCIDQKKDAILCSGFPVSTDFSQKGIGKVIMRIRDYKKIRMLGSAALSLAYVSCGRADAYIENDIKIWDVAAGLSIVKAAGGDIKFSFRENRKILNVRAGKESLY
jgi:myo-inositol-1(or 4)-monophosphatase